MTSALAKTTFVLVHRNSYVTCHIGSCVDVVRKHSEVCKVLGIRLFPMINCKNHHYCLRKLFSDCGNKHKCFSLKFFSAFWSSIFQGLNSRVWLNAEILGTKAELLGRALWMLFKLHWPGSPSLCGLASPVYHIHHRHVPWVLEANFWLIHSGK